MLASSLALAGGVLLTSAGPASAVTGGLETCTSFSTVVDLGTGAATGTISGCNSKGLNPGNITLNVATATGSIFWAAGHATSLISAIPEVGVGDCSTVGTGADLPVTVVITVLDGPFSGTTGGGVLCLDFGTFNLVNNGPITL
jgi:hypothetical protein